MSERDLGLAPLLLPSPHADVRWVAVSELADPSPFLEGGEVLLTTGLDMDTGGMDWEEYVARMARAGVAAIGFAVGLTHAHVPEGLLASCAAREVNLFEVPRQTTFVAVSRTVARLLEATEQAAARRALDVQQRLTQAALHEHHTTGLLRTLAAAIEGAAQLVTPEGVGRDDPVGPRGELIDGDVVASEVERIQRHGLRAAASASTPSGTLMIQPIGVRGRPESYLVAAFPGRVNDLPRSSVMTTVALLSLAAERNRSRRETERRLRARALEVLLAWDVRTAALLLEAKDAEPARPRFPSRLTVLRAVGSPDLREDVLRAVEDAFQLSGLLDHELVVAVPPRAVGQALQILGRFTGLRAGVGEEMPVAELQRSYLTAGHALAATSEAVPVVYWERNVRQGALSIIEPKRAEAFAASVLGPLAGELEGIHLETLHSFLRHHGSLIRVAEELRVHRNTVRNRVARIERDLSRTLDDPQTRVDVWLALQARASLEHP
jgi:PucR family transcriptional regulator, purine catabolism regulatory protein